MDWSAPSDPNELLVCPYDPVHRVPAKRFQYHLLKCRKNHPDKDFVSCPFNAKHVVLRPDLRHHICRCPDRGEIEKYSYRASEKDAEGFYFKGDTSVPSYGNRHHMHANDNDWDQESDSEEEQSSTYGPVSGYHSNQSDLPSNLYSGNQQPFPSTLHNGVQDTLSLDPQDREEFKRKIRGQALQQRSNKPQDYREQSNTRPRNAIFLQGLYAQRSASHNGATYADQVQDEWDSEETTSDVNRSYNMGLASRRGNQFASIQQNDYSNIVSSGTASNPGRSSSVVKQSSMFSRGSCRAPWETGIENYGQRNELNQENEKPLCKDNISYLSYALGDRLGFYPNEELIHEEGKRVVQTESSVATDAVNNALKEANQTVNVGVNNSQGTGQSGMSPPTGAVSNASKAANQTVNVGINNSQRTSQSGKSPSRGRGRGRAKLVAEAKRTNFGTSSGRVTPPIGRGRGMLNQSNRFS